MYQNNKRCSRNSRTKRIIAKALTDTTNTQQQHNRTTKQITGVEDDTEKENESSISIASVAALPKMTFAEKINAYRKSRGETKAAKRKLPFLSDDDIYEPDTFDDFQTLPEIVNGTDLQGGSHTLEVPVLHSIIQRDHHSPQPPMISNSVQLFTQPSPVISASQSATPVLPPNFVLSSIVASPKQDQAILNETDLQGGHHTPRVPVQPSIIQKDHHSPQPPMISNSVQPSTQLSPVISASQSATPVLPPNFVLSSIVASPKQDQAILNETDLQGGHHTPRVPVQPSIIQKDHHSPQPPMISNSVQLSTQPSPVISASQSATPVLPPNFVLSSIVASPKQDQAILNETDLQGGSHTLEVPVQPSIIQKDHHSPQPPMISNSVQPSTQRSPVISPSQSVSPVLPSNVTGSILSSIAGSSKSDKPILKENKLYEFLQGSSDGRTIIQHYLNNSKLNKQTRLLLSDLIVRSELQADPNKLLGTKDFSLFASLINEVFPRESINSYYIPAACVNGKKKVATGMLYNKYTNLCSTYINYGIRAKRRKKKETPSFSYNLELSDEQYKEDINWLESRIHPWELAVQKWAATANRRLHDFETSESTIDEYIEKFPILSSANASQLIEIDFSVRYEQQRNLLHNVWPHLKKSILSFAKTKLPRDATFARGIRRLHADLDSENEVVSSVAAFVCLLYLSPIVTLSKKHKPPAIPASTSATNSTVAEAAESGEAEVNESDANEEGESKKLWRPSRTEIVNSILLHVPTTDTFDTSIQERIDFCNARKMKCQAFIILTGEVPDHSHIVFFNRKLYITRDIVSALDLCFKIFMVFQAEYPPEGSLFWTFVQKFIYNISTVHDDDRTMSSLNTLAADLDIF